MTLVFYDTETTGTSAAFDQILQFAAVRTDAGFRVLDSLNIRCRLQPHIVPSPGAMMVTGITAAQLLDPTLPSHYEMVREIRARLTSWSPSIFVGHNSIAFDEKFLRQALYQTVHSPYLTNAVGCGRSDAMRLAQAASIHAPNSIAFPLNEKGERTFKLERLAPANGFNHSLAHDAMGDVEATIFLCRLISESAPEVWSSFMRFSTKHAVADFIGSERTFCISEYYYGRPYSWLVAPIGVDPTVSTDHYVFDLSVDPANLRGLSEDELVARLGKTPKPVRRIKTNAVPMLAEASELPPSVRGKYEESEVEKRLALLDEDTELRERLVASFAEGRGEREASAHIEEQIYDDFYENSDLQVIERFHSAPWERRIAIAAEFSDRRLQKLATRLTYLERPDLLEHSTRVQYGIDFGQRMNGVAEAGRWSTIDGALAELEQALLSADEPTATFLNLHRAYLEQCRARCSAAV